MKKEEMNKKEVDYIPNSSLSSYIHDIKGFQPLSPEQEAVIWNNRTPENLELMINSHLRLVISIVLKTVPAANRKEDRIMDLIQAGNFGLIKAVQNFNPDMNVKFSTYAYNWIQTYVNNEVVSEKCGCIKKPKAILECFSVISKIENRFASVMGRYPTDAEMPVLLDGIFPEEKINEVISLKKINVVSLDTPVNSIFEFSEEKKLEDIIEDSRNFVEEFEQQEQSITLKNEIRKILKPRLYFLVCARFGLDEFEGEEPKKLEEVAQLFVEKGYNDTLISIERVRQLESKALSLLRNNERLIKLFKTKN